MCFYVEGNSFCRTTFIFFAIQCCLANRQTLHTWLNVNVRPFQNYLSLSDNLEHNLSTKQYIVTIIF